MRKLLENTREHSQRDGDETAANHNGEENGNQIVERAHLAGCKTQRLQDGLHTMAHMHEQAADSHNVEQGAPGVGERGNDVVVAIVRVTVESQLPQVEHQEAENHHTREHHRAGGKRGLERTLLLVVGAGGHVLILEHQREHHVHQQNGKKTQADSHEQPGRHGVQTGRVCVNPRGLTGTGISTVDGHVTGKVSHEEQEEARPGQRHKNLAADGGRDKLTCCRDNVVHKCNNVFA